MREYPVSMPSSAPATGRLLYQHLMENIKIPAAANHEIWYAGMEAQLESPKMSAFRGVTPEGETLELKTLMGKAFNKDELSDNVEQVSSELFNYTFSGDEQYILVSDLSESARELLDIPANARDKDKVYNANFKAFEDLDKFTKWSNELAALSVPKSISSYLAGTKMNVNYSERDVVEFLGACFSNLSSAEMSHVLHGNHLAWAALDYMRSEGNVEGDLMAEFHGQNPVDFYVKDFGTVLPGLFYALASLGQDPKIYLEKIDIDVWGAEEAAIYMKEFMPKEKAGLQAV
jgi:hypothetical protein